MKILIICITLSGLVLVQGSPFVKDEKKNQTASNPEALKRVDRARISQNSNAIADGLGGTALSQGEATVAGRFGQFNSAFQNSNALTGDFGTSISKGLSQALNGNANQLSTALSGRNGVSLADGTANAINGQANQASLSGAGAGGTAISTGKANSIGQNAGANQESSSLVHGGGGTAISTGSATSVSGDQGPPRYKREIPEGCHLEEPLVHTTISYAIKDALNRALNQIRIKRQLTRVHNSYAYSGDDGDSLAVGVSEIFGVPGSAIQNSYSKSGLNGHSVSEGKSSVQLILKKRDTVLVCPMEFQVKVGNAIDQAVMNALAKFVR